jgi:hypothetical protein
MAEARRTSGYLEERKDKTSPRGDESKNSVGSRAVRMCTVRPNGGAV